MCFPADVLRPLASLTEDLASASDVRFGAVIDPELPGVRVPEAALREAVSNLIDNGLKYCEPTPSGGARLLGLCCRWDEAAQRILILVWNSAAPLPDEELEAAFQWGARGRAAASDVGGSGYGLLIVRRLVELMGGTVRLSNAPLPDWLRAVLPPEVAEERPRPVGVSGCIYLPRNVVAPPPE